MKNGIKLLILLASAASLQVHADEYGRVISSTAIIQQVAVPRQICSQQQVTTQANKSGAGALMGAIAGGTVGNALGRGGDRTMGTMLGAFGGAILGDKIEGAPPPETRTVQSCSTQNVYENRTVAYNVIYEYAGKQYSVQMPQDPGSTIRLQVTPAISSNNNYNYPAPPPGSAPQYMQ